MFKNKKLNKKGFTIIELVVVIAIVAILAAVLIPMFINVSKRANMSADEQTVYEMNLALSIDEVENGTQANAFDMIQHMEAEGYNFSTKPFTSNYGYYWNKEINRVVLVDITVPEIVYPEQYIGAISSSDLVDSVTFITQGIGTYFSLSVAQDSEPSTTPIVDGTLILDADGNQYTDLQTALTSVAATGGKIALLDNVTIEEITDEYNEVSVNLTDDVAIDLNGYKITLNGLMVSNAEVNINNGTIDYIESTGGLFPYPFKVDNSTLTLNNVTVGAWGGNAVQVSGNSNVVINDSTINGVINVIAPTKNTVNNLTLNNVTVKATGTQALLVSSSKANITFSIKINGGIYDSQYLVKAIASSQSAKVSVDIDGGSKVYVDDKDQPITGTTIADSERFSMTVEDAWLNGAVWEGTWSSTDGKFIVS